MAVSARSIFCLSISLPAKWAMAIALGIKSLGLPCLRSYAAFAKDVIGSKNSGSLAIFAAIRRASSFVSSLAVHGTVVRVRRLRWGLNHYDSAAALPPGVIESQPLVWPNLASSSHPCALAYLIAGRISPSFNPVSAAT
jgi:hypothetical protein